MTILEEQHQIAFSNLTTPVWIYDTLNDKVWWANDSALKLWEAETLEELCQRDFSVDMSDAMKLLLVNYLDDFQIGHKHSQWWTLRPKGKAKKIYAHFSGIRLKGGRMAMLCEAAIDDLAMGTEFCLSSGNSMASLYNTDMRLQSCNQTFRELYGEQIDKFSQLFSDQNSADKLIRQLDHISLLESELELPTPNGLQWYRLEMRYIRNQGEQQILLTQQNISRRKEQELKNQHLAHYDVLTGLLNRYGLLTKLEELIQVGQPVAILYLDLDGFKLVNDNYGHSTGDQLLKKVGNRLQQVAPEALAISRLGGDEFVLVLTAPPTDNYLGQRAGQIINQLSDSYTLKGLHDIRLSASIGIASFPNDSDTVESLLMHADTAMYHAKDSGRKTFAHFTPSMAVKVQRKHEIKQQLQHGLERNEFSLRYQPVIDIRNNQLVGFEALLRWHNASLGPVGPEEFIPIAEETGVINSLGAWILNEACCQVGSWRRKYCFDFNLSVNLSTIQLHDTNFIPIINSALKQSGLPVEKLVLEITETKLMHNIDEAAQLLVEATLLGLHIAIDDFGTGYSSLSYLHKLPITCLKIDRSFISDINQGSLPIIRTTMALTEQLGMKTIAEGVEDMDQLEQLRELNCIFVQGYLFSQPMYAGELEAVKFRLDTPAGEIRARSLAPELTTIR